MWTSFTFFGKSFVTISLLLFATMLVVTNADKDNKKECDNDKQCFKNAVCNSDHECTCKTWQIYERTGKSEKCTDVKCKTDKGCSELNKILSPTADIYSCNTKTGLCQCDPVKGKVWKFIIFLKLFHRQNFFLTRSWHLTALAAMTLSLIRFTPSSLSLQWLPSLVASLAVSSSSASAVVATRRALVPRPLLPLPSKAKVAPPRWAKSQKCEDKVAELWPSSLKCVYASTFLLIASPLLPFFGKIFQNF